MFAYCGNNPINRNDPNGEGWISSLFVTVVVIAVKRVISAVVKNIKSSKKASDRKAVDSLMQNRLIEENNVQIPPDPEGLLYNRENREYASKIIEEDLGPNTKRTEEDISCEIFAHVFVADIFKPLSILSGKVPPEYDIYFRLSKADIDEAETRTELFYWITEVFEWD